MVLVAHSTGLAGFPKGWIKTTCLIFDGHLGVRFFFVISGFLITYLLIREHDQHGLINLKNFYLRRGLRILPVYGAYLLGVVILELVTNLHQTGFTWFCNVTFLTNFIPNSSGWITAHLWSLSVEEQFYLLWPLSLVWLLKMNRRWLCMALAMPILIAIITHVFAFLHCFPWILRSLFQPRSSFVNFDSLDIGCMAAFVFAWYEMECRAFLKKERRWLAILFGILLIVSAQFFWGVAVVFSGVLQSLGFAVLLLASILFPLAFRFLNWAWVQWLGTLSYSIYIWQQIFCAAPDNYGCTSIWWMTFPYWIVPAILTAIVSYYGLERPLLRLRARYRR